LAGHLKKTVSELLDGMDAQELTEWMAFSTIEPLDADRADIHAAQVCSTTANVWRGSETKVLEVKDFIPDWYGETKKADNFAGLKAWAQAMGTKKT
jgi:Protein of unknown function (DUF4035)